jgi:hypothetical protein
VTARASPRADSQPPEWEVYIVEHDDQVVTNLLDLEFNERLCDGLTRSIHEGLGRQHGNGIATASSIGADDLTLPESSREPRLAQRETTIDRETLHDPNTDIVTAAGVAFAGIPQAYDQL